MEVYDIVKFNLKDGDTLFVNADTIDVFALRDSLSNVFSGVRVAIIPVLPMVGQTVPECLAVASQDKGLSTSGPPDRIIMKGMA